MRTELSFEVAPISDARIVWNKEELSAMVDTIVSQYKGLAYTAEQIQDAKKDRANLNKALTAIETERKRVKAEYLGPYTAFEDEVKEITSKIKGAIDEIDAQTRAYEAEQKAVKRAAQEKERIERERLQREAERAEIVTETQPQATAEPEPQLSREDYLYSPTYKMIDLTLEQAKELIRFFNDNHLQFEVLAKEKRRK